MYSLNKHDKRLLPALLSVRKIDKLMGFQNVKGGNKVMCHQGQQAN